MNYWWCESKYLDAIPASQPWRKLPARGLASAKVLASRRRAHPGTVLHLAFVDWETSEMVVVAQKSGGRWVNILTQPAFGIGVDGEVGGVREVCDV